MKVVISCPELEPMEVVGIAETQEQVVDMVKQLFHNTEFTLLEDDSTAILISNDEGTKFVGLEIYSGEGNEWSEEASETIFGRLLEIDLRVEVVDMDPGDFVGFTEEDMETDEGVFVEGYVVVES